MSLGSRDQHKVEVNLGLKKFLFNVDTYLQETHYQEIYAQIQLSDKKKFEKLKPKQETERKVAMADQFHQLVHDYLIAQGFNETIKAVFEDTEISRTIDQLTGAKENRPIVDKLQIDLRGKIKHFILTGKIQEASALLEEHFPDLWKSNKVIECSLASIQFIQYFTDNDLANALKMLDKHPLNHSQIRQSFNLLVENKQQMKYRIISVDKHGAVIYLEPEHLTRLFILQPSHSMCSQKLDPLLSEKHTLAIANYINDQIVSFLKQSPIEAPSINLFSEVPRKQEAASSSHLEQLLRHLTLDLNYGLNQFNKHSLWECNPVAKNS